MSHHRIIQRNQLNEPMRKSIGLLPRNTNTDIYIWQTTYHSTLNVLRHSISQTDILKPHVSLLQKELNEIQLNPIIRNLQVNIDSKHLSQLTSKSAVQAEDKVTYLSLNVAVLL